MVRNIIGKLNASAPVFRHDPHLNWRCVGREPVPVHRQPMSFGKVEKHCRVAARGNDAPSRGFWPEPLLLEIFQSHHALHAIFSIQEYAGSTVGIEHRRGRGQLREPPSCLLAARAKASDRHDRHTDCLELYLAAPAGRVKVFVLLQVQGAVPLITLNCTLHADFRMNVIDTVGDSSWVRSIRYP